MFWKKLHLEKEVKDSDKGEHLPYHLKYYTLAVVFDNSNAVCRISTADTMCC